jgi:hypothetical protein
MYFDQIHPIYVTFSFFSLFCCAGWGYIVAFTKVLTMYQLYHTWIHPFHCSALSPSPNFWNIFTRYHFCIYIHMYRFFALYSPSYPLSLPPPSSHWSQPDPWAGPYNPSSSLFLFNSFGCFHCAIFKISNLLLLKEQMMHRILAFSNFYRFSFQHWSIKFFKSLGKLLKKFKKIYLESLFLNYGSENQGENNHEKKTNKLIRQMPKEQCKFKIYCNITDKNSSQEQVSQTFSQAYLSTSL